MSQFKGFHHFYLGIALMLLSFPLIWVNLYVALGLMLVGFWVAMDDVYQHTRQIKEPDYHSPLHRLYGKYLWKVEWIRKLNQWIDKRMT